MFIVVCQIPWYLCPFLPYYIPRRSEMETFLLCCSVSKKKCIAVSYSVQQLPFAEEVRRCWGREGTCFFLSAPTQKLSSVWRVVGAVKQNPKQVIQNSQVSFKLRTEPACEPRVWASWWEGLRGPSWSASLLPIWWAFWKLFKRVGPRLYWTLGSLREP